MFDKNTWNHIDVRKQMSSKNSFKTKVSYKILADKS